MEEKIKDQIYGLLKTLTEKYLSYYLRSDWIFAVKVSYGYAPSTVVYFKVLRFIISVPGVPPSPKDCASAVSASKAESISFDSKHFFHF
jgi:hypothetical protein